MTKADFLRIFFNNPKSNFIITTNIAVGQGLNGVDYLTFVGAYVNHYLGGFNSNKELEDYTYTNIVGVNDDCVVLHQEKKDAEDYWKSGEKDFYIPLNNIVMIEFLREDCRPYRGEYPKEIKSAHYLGEYPKINK